MLHSITYLYLIGYSLTFHGSGLTVHGIQQNGTEAYYKNKLNDRTTLHPIEFGLTYKNKHFETGAIYLKDSFDNHAGLVYAGYKYDLGKYFSLGAGGGVYFRESMTTQHFKYGTKVGAIDIIPMPGITGSARIPIRKNVSFELNVMSNYVINHINTGIRLDF